VFETTFVITFAATLTNSANSRKSPGESHWNLWMADSKPIEEGLFALALFTQTEFVLVFGSQRSSDVRLFAESQFPDDPNVIVETARQRFRYIAWEIRIPLAPAVTWIESL
jgi:hypothetical protein